MIYVLEQAINCAREWYYKKCGRYLPFICISHDKYDAKRKEYIGVSIHFVLPITWRLYSFAIGLSRAVGNSAADMIKVIEPILHRFNIKKEDIFR